MVPAFYKGTLSISGAPTDTYLALCGWGKGQVRAVVCKYYI